MTKIADLSAVTALAAGDSLPVASLAGGDTMRATMGQLTEYLQENLVFTGADEAFQTAAPTTGQTVTVTVTDGRNVWLALAPAGTLATLTVAISGTPSAQQEVLINTTQILTALTITASNTLQGQPTTLAANGFAKMKYDAVNAVWRRVG